MFALLRVAGIFLFLFVNESPYGFLYDVIQDINTLYDVIQDINGSFTNPLNNLFKVLADEID